MILVTQCLWICGIVALYKSLSYYYYYYYFSCYHVRAAFH